MSGPLAGQRAEALRIARPRPADLGSGQPPERNLLNRGRPAVALDLKNAEGQALALRLAAQADALVERFRPGVMERLGLGPAECHRVNPRLVYGRVAGWGQGGPLSCSAGHDLNYIALIVALGRGSRGDRKARRAGRGGLKRQEKGGLPCTT